MFKRYLMVSAFIVSALAAPTLFAQDYDLVITGGRVMDPETMYDDVANVGIKDGRIATITKEKISGRETIKAKGMVVAPGFIDTHFHFQMPIGYSLGLRDGLTSSMDFEMGCAGSYIARLVRGARRCDPGQLWLCGQPRVCPRDGHRRVKRRLLAGRSHSRS